MNIHNSVALAQDLSISFEYWSCELNTKELRKWGSPHFDRKTVGEAVTQIFYTRRIQHGQGTLDVSRNLVAVSNHAYPEAALVDPVADLELWEEWRLGIREFPYLGRYAPLGIFHQAGKTSSTSSVGVIGEILAGRFAESLIAPTVIVRVVRRWPDFILYAGAHDASRRFAFVESKAVGPDSMPAKALCSGRIPAPQFSELADQVIRQLNADPFVEIWGAFTFIRTIAPLQADMTLVRFIASDDKKAESRRAGVPAPVLSGLAERCLGAALAEMSDEARVGFLDTPRKKQYRKETETRLVEVALGHLKSIVQGELAHSTEIAVEDIAPYLERALARLPREVYLPGRRTRDARHSSQIVGALVPIGSAGGQQIFMADLPEVDQHALGTDWTPDWAAASQPWDSQNGVRLWRAGGAVFAIGDPSLAGMPVSPRGLGAGPSAVHILP